MTTGVGLPIFSTRVLLRPWSLSDANVLFRLASDANVAAGAGFPVHGNVGDSSRVIREILTVSECYAIVLREANAVVGCIQLFAESGRSVYEAECPEIGYWLGRPYWGAGLMSEAVATICRHCFGSGLFRASMIVAKVKQDNVASKRVLEKSGFALERNGERCEYRIWRRVQ